MRLTIRELSLITLCVAIALGWALDGWFDGRVARDTSAETFKRLFDSLEVETHRIANERAVQK